jgi:hypothetical protein
MSMKNAIGQPYIAAVSILASAVGDWFPTEDIDTVSLSADLDIGAGTVTGYVYGEFTADFAAIKGISRILMPYGCLHTNLAGVAMASDASAINVTAATSGAFTVSISAPGVGRMRWGWHFTSGTGASPNFIRVYSAGNNRP